MDQAPSGEGALLIFVGFTLTTEGLVISYVRS